MNEAWALAELERLMSLLAVKGERGLYRVTYVGSDDEIAEQLVTVERIWEVVLNVSPVKRDIGNDPYARHRELTVRCIASIKREAEIRENLGENAPDLSVAKMHPWIWDGARSLWQSGHFAEAVGAAARKLNAEMQNKVHRRDIAETDLFKQAFSDDAPSEERYRLRLPGDDDGQTARSVRRGVRSFAEGCFAAIRNPLAHDGGELNETEALEQLAALSILARWVAQADVAVS